MGSFLGHIRFLIRDSLHIHYTYKPKRKTFNHTTKAACKLLKLWVYWPVLVLETVYSFKIRFARGPNDLIPDEPSFYKSEYSFSIITFSDRLDINSISIIIELYRTSVQLRSSIKPLRQNGPMSEY